jgi:hypothetical protein
MTDPATKNPTPEQLVEEMIKHIIDELVRHHEAYNIRCSGDFWEERLDTALNRTRLGSDWTPGSHAVSTDTSLTGANNMTVSVKSGTVTGQEEEVKLTISGSRLGKHSGNMDAMLAHVKTTSAEVYVCLSHRDTDWKFKDDSGADRKVQDTDDKVYNLFVFPSSLLDYGQPSDWDDHQTPSGHTVWALPRTEPRKMSAEIRGSMSHQLWTKIDVALIGEPTIITIPGKVVAVKAQKGWHRRWGLKSGNSWLWPRISFRKKPSASRFEK